jgi:hypothetical protein
MLPEFLELYQDRPIKNNAGGMGFNHCFATYAIGKKLAPKVVIESGVWRGQSTWLFEQICPDAQLICIDPNPGLRIYTSARAAYHTDDFALIDWSHVDRESALCFFDDHQNAYQRLMEMKWWGFRRGIFEDNFPSDEGDSYSIRHVMAGVGHPHILMPRHVGPVDEQGNRDAKERVLLQFYARQSVIRQPNTVDRAALKVNVKMYQEMPPVVRYPVSDWGRPWEGAYETAAPLYSSFEDPALSIDLEAVEREDPKQAFSYCYLCYVELR